MHQINKNQREDMKIDIDDAVDRLQCMAREIVIHKSLSTELKESLEKDRELLKSLIPVLDSLRNLEEI